jgi:hypothetical protein
MGDFGDVGGDFGDVGGDFGDVGGDFGDTTMPETSFDDPVFDAPEAGLPTEAPELDTLPQDEAFDAAPAESVAYDDLSLPDAEPLPEAEELDLTAIDTPTDPDVSDAFLSDTPEAAFDETSSVDEAIDLTDGLDAVPDQTAPTEFDEVSDESAAAEEQAAAEAAETEAQAAAEEQAAVEAAEAEAQTAAEAAEAKAAQAEADAAQHEELRFGELQPNTTYERNGYTYETDEQGRVTQVYGDLHLGESHRTTHQTEVGHMGLEGDEGGHLVGARFGGSPEGMNLVPQNMHLNRSDWKVMENEWADALEQGKDVAFSTSLAYDEDQAPTGRPSDFIVNYMIDGVTYTKYFPNSAEGSEELV